MNKEKKEDYFVPDSALENPEEDRFNRASFAERIAETIIKRKDNSSMIVGIYGMWGEGKTTVLNFINEYIKENYPNFICVRFNPWRVGSEEELLSSFFNLISEEVEKSLPEEKKKEGNVFKKIGVKILSSKYFSDFGIENSGIKLPVGKMINKIISHFSKNDFSYSMENLRHEAEKLLSKEKRKIVVLIDDIDRLDKKEIQSMFKLIKLNADFQNITYILAFDNEMVAAALAEKYGEGNIEAGRNYLEKIIQVPLSLPKANSLALRQVCFDGLNKAFKMADIDISDEEVARFKTHFIDAIEVKIKTPRMAKRFGNSMEFLLPLIKLEVNITDFILIEGIKMFYPNLYKAIKDNPDLFLVDGMQISANEQKNKDRMKKVMEEALKGLPDDESEVATNLIKELFPKTNSFFSNISYGYDWNVEWYKNKRIAVPEYFNKYFSYSVGNDEVSDEEFESIIKDSSNDAVGFVQKIKKIINDGKIAKFLSRLRKIDGKSLNLIAIESISTVLSELAPIFPDERYTLFDETPFNETSLILARLTSHIENEEKRLNLAKKIIKDAKSISFAAMYLRYVSNITNETDNTKLFSSDGIIQLGEALTSRVREAITEEDFFEKYERYVIILLKALKTWGNEGELDKFISNDFAKNPQNALKLLKCYLPVVFGGGHILPKPGNFETDEYKSLVATFNPEVIIEALKKSHGDIVESKEMSKDEKTIFEFRRIYEIEKTKGEVRGEGNSEKSD